MLTPEALHERAAQILLGAIQRGEWIDKRQAYVVCEALDDLRRGGTCETHKKRIKQLEQQVHGLKCQLMAACADGRTRDLGPDYDPDEPGLDAVLCVPLNDNDERRRLVARIEELRARNKRLNLAVHSLFLKARKRGAKEPA